MALARPVAELRRHPPRPDLLRLRPRRVHGADHGHRHPRRARRPVSASPRRCPTSAATPGAPSAPPLLGAILHAYLSTGSTAPLGRVAPSGRDLVAEGFRTALLVAAVLLLAGAAAASRMPRLEAHEPPWRPPPPLRRPGGPVTRPAPDRGLPRAGARHARPHRARGGSSASPRPGATTRRCSTTTRSPPSPARADRDVAASAWAWGWWCPACAPRPPPRPRCAPCRRSRPGRVRAAVGRRLHGPVHARGRAGAAGAPRARGPRPAGPARRRGAPRTPTAGDRSWTCRCRAPRARARCRCTSPAAASGRRRSRAASATGR